MADNIEYSNCRTKCWKIGAMVGALIWIILWLLTGFGFFGALLWGIIVGIITGFVLIYTRCNGDSSAVKPMQAANVSPAPAKSETAPQAEAPTTAAISDVDVTPKPSVAKATPAAEMSIKPSATLAGEDELSSRKGEWKYEAEAKKPVTETAPVAPASAAEVAKAEPEATVAVKPAKVNVAEPAKPDSVPDKPEMLSAPRAEGKDDLKLISGVGPKLEETLNGLGVYHFDQVAKWTKADIAWVDDNLRFKGRIERDDWMSQADILAKGGETEFSKKK